jgi:hypothetical protein
VKKQTAAVASLARALAVARATPAPPAGPVWAETVWAPGSLPQDVWAPNVWEGMT